MGLLRLSWKNLTSKPLSMLLSLVLFALGVGLISLLMLINNQMQDKFDKNLAGIDLVVGSKGSPLQLILSSMYHVDVPTGNIKIKECKAFFNPKHPFIEKAIPLSMGDSYKSYRIIGTNPDLIDIYEGKIESGKIWEKDFEVTIGANIAKDLNLNIGDEFNSSHGFVMDDNLVHDDIEKFKVVGILKPTGSVLDQLILTSTPTYWKSHGSHDHGDHDGHDHGDHDGHNHEDHDHNHDHAHHDGHDHDAHAHDHSGEHADDHAHKHDEPATTATTGQSLTDFPEQEITTLLLFFKHRNFQTLNMQRNINENTEMQAATPAIEINRLYSMMDGGMVLLQRMAYLIVFVSGLSIFIALYNSLRDRKYELAQIRVMGGSKSTLFSLIILEGLLLAVLGFIIGILLSHVGMSLFAGYLKDSYQYTFDGWKFLPEEGLLLIGALVIGFVSAIIPAIQASKTDISTTLTNY